jgi:CDP-glycerol glycerophosphotransferase
MLEVGYPRNDLLLDPVRSEEARRRVRHELGVARGERVVLYAPTWREYAGVRNAKPLFLDAEAVVRALSDTVVLVRGHYNATRGKEVFADHPRIHDVTRYPDIAPLYCAADVLVTDYSSVMFDFVLTDRPVLLLVPDLEQYRNVERGFYFDIEERSPGPMLVATDQVIEVLRSPDTAQAARQEFRSEFCPWDDGAAAARAVDWLLERLGSSGG